MLRSIVATAVLIVPSVSVAQNYQGIQDRSAVSYRVFSGIGSTCRMDIVTAASLWNSVGADITFTNSGTSSTRVGRTKSSTTYVEPGPLIPEVPANAAAFTDIDYSSSSGAKYDYDRGLWRFRNFNVIINETMLADGSFYCGPISKVGQGAIPNGKQYLLDVASHEFGHGLGLDHDNAVYPTMMYAPAFSSYAKRYLSERDKTGARNVTSW